MDVDTDILMFSTTTSSPHTRLWLVEKIVAKNVQPQMLLLLLDGKPFPLKREKAKLFEKIARPEQRAVTCQRGKN